MMAGWRYHRPDHHQDIVLTEWPSPGQAEPRHRHTRKTRIPWEKILFSDCGPAARPGGAARRLAGYNGTQAFTNTTATQILLTAVNVNT